MRDTTWGELRPWDAVDIRGETWRVIVAEADDIRLTTYLALLHPAHGLHRGEKPPGEKVRRHSRPEESVWDVDPDVAAARAQEYANAAHETVATTWGELVGGDVVMTAAEPWIVVYSGGPNWTLNHDTLGEKVGAPDPKGEIVRLVRPMEPMKLSPDDLAAGIAKVTDLTVHRQGGMVEPVAGMDDDVLRSHLFQDHKLEPSALTHRLQLETEHHAAHGRLHRTNHEHSTGA